MVAILQSLALNFAAMRLATMEMWYILGHHSESQRETGVCRVRYQEVRHRQGERGEAERTGEGVN